MGGEGPTGQGPDEQGIAFTTRPESRGKLAAWLRAHLKLEIPQEALIDGHDAPFDYLCHAFFDGREPEDEAIKGDERQHDESQVCEIKDAVGERSGGGEQVFAPWDAPQPDAVVWANRGGGKTFLAAVATVLDLVHKHGIAVRILGGSLEQSDRVFAHLRGMFDEHGLLGEMLDGKITTKGAKLTNGSEVRVLAQSERAVRGVRVQKIRCDEVELFKPAVWEAAQLAVKGKWCGADKKLWVPGTIECLSTMHQPYGLMYRIVGDSARRGDRKGDERTLFKWGVIDVLERCPADLDCGSCPLHGSCGGKAKRPVEGSGVAPAGGHLAVSDVIAMRGRVGDGTWQAEMLCTRPRRDDCVIPQFDPTRHVFRETPSSVLAGEGVVWIGGMDFGIRAPTVVLWASVDGEGVVRVLGERVVAGEVTASHVEAIVGGGSGPLSPFPVPAWIGVDPAGRQRSEQTGVSAVEVMKRAGLAVRDRRLGIEPGLELIRARLAPASGGPRLFVHASCVGLIESLERYRYPSERPESLTPVKDGSDHAVDALRYMIQNLDAAYRAASGRYV